MSRPNHAFPAAVQSAPLPKVINHTPWPSQYFQHVDPYGEIFHVMVNRMSYSLASFVSNQDEFPEPKLLATSEQIPLCEADEFTGEVNASSLIQESDFAPYKPKCDVLLVNATAYSPAGRPAKGWAVGFRFGTAIEKYLQVTGPRHYKRSALTGKYFLSQPQNCTSVPICYERAFGGPNLEVEEKLLSVYAKNTNPAQHIARASQQILDELPERYQANPIGCGRDISALHKIKQAIAQLETMISNTPAAQSDRIYDSTEYLIAPQIEKYRKSYQEEESYPVIGFGPIGRWWTPRIRFAGTHDAYWKQQQWPKSPLDHDYRYWNCAPADQQIDYPVGGEEIVLAYLTPESALHQEALKFLLPKQDMRLLVRLEVGVVMFAPMHIDTVILNFQNMTLSVVRRATISARTQVRQLELGTWTAGTAMQLDHI